MTRKCDIKGLVVFRWGLVLALLLNLGAPSEVAYSVPMDMEANLREACRRVIAGKYLVAYDDARQAKNFIQIMESKLKKLKVELKRGQTRMKKAKAAATQNDYSVKAEREYQNSLSFITVIENQIKENDAILATAHKTLIDSRKIERGLTSRMGQVFVLKTEKFAETKGGYPFKLQYRLKCPKYRYQCPLTVPDARSLLKVLVPPPEVCVKYSNFTREK